MTLDPNKTFLALEQAAEEWVSALEDALRLEELKKPVLAQMTLEMQKKYNIKSRVDAETRALASEEYCTHADAIAIARAKANRAQAKYKNLQILAELRRSQEATERALAR